MHGHPPRPAEAYGKLLEDPAPDEGQKPREVVRALEIRPGEVIAGVGAGSGHFPRRPVSGWR